MNTPDIVLSRGPIPSQADHLHDRGMARLAADLAAVDPEPFCEFTGPPNYPEPARVAEADAPDSLSLTVGTTHPAPGNPPAPGPTDPALEAAVECNGPVRADRLVGRPAWMGDPSEAYRVLDYVATAIRRSAKERAARPGSINAAMGLGMLDAVSIIFDAMHQCTRETLR